MKAELILPDQLFSQSPLGDGAKFSIVYEHPFAFSRLQFHKCRLVLLRASMKKYAQRLMERKKKTLYLGFESDLEKELSKNKIDSLCCVRPAERKVEELVKRICKKTGIELCFIENPAFITSEDFYGSFFEGKEHLSMSSFYAAQRKRLGVLMEDGKPIGGKYSFDTANRKALGREVEVPKTYQPRDDEFLKEARKYVEDNFGDNPGSSEEFRYPTDSGQARRLLCNFLDDKFELFGDYEDAVSRDEPILFHSLLSSSMNTGLVRPGEVLEKAVAHFEKHNIPINSAEGFIRQLIGWREFMRIAYLLHGERMERDNFFGCDNSLPGAFYEASTGVEPVDNTISSVLETGYAHHIERLMVLGNFMLLCEIKPCDVCKWFSEMFIDAWHWVMVPNVHGMSQFSTGGLITSKPYISSSNYILKMSNYKKGRWCEVWDGLFWRFVDKHKEFFENNQRTKPLVWQLNKMNTAKLNGHIRTADKYLAELF